MGTMGMESDAFSPAKALEIRGLDTLKVMADSRRMQIVDLLRRAAATVKELAAAMQVSPKSLYYHVNLLEKHGLIRVVDTRIVSGILEKRYRATAYLFNFEEIADAEASTPTGRRFEAVSSLFAITRDEIRVALEAGIIDPVDEAPATAYLNVNWRLLNLSPAALHDLGRRVSAVFDEYDTGEMPSEEEQPYRLLFALFPTYRLGKRSAPPPLDPSTGGTS